MTGEAHPVKNEWSFIHYKRMGGNKMEIVWGKIKLLSIVVLMLGVAAYKVSPITVPTAEAGETDSSVQIVFRGYISEAKNAYQEADNVSDLTVVPAYYDWGNLWVGFSEALEVTIENGGADTLNISGLTISETENFSLAVDGGSNPCGDVPVTLDSGTSCTCLVTFHPQFEATFSAILSVDCDDPDTPIAQIDLTGTGVPNTFGLGGVNYSVNIDSGCSIVPAAGDGMDGLIVYAWLVPALLWLGIRRKGKEGRHANDE